MKFKLIYFFLALFSFFLFFCFSVQQKLWSDYLLIEQPENKSIPKEKDLPKEKKEEPAVSFKFPSNTAININVSPIKGTERDVSISWKLTEGSTGDFILGRTTEKPVTIEAALKAISIRVLSANEKQEFVDRNLPDGEYYYLVLSKDRVINNTLKLFENNNYIINPVKIPFSDKQLEPPSKKFLVTGFDAALRTIDSILLNWNTIDDFNGKYVLYRHTKVIDSPALLKESTEIAKLSKDIKNYIDRNVQKGKYYYAIIAEDETGNKNFEFREGINYTIDPVYIGLDINPAVIIAQQVKKDIFVKWSYYYDAKDGNYLLLRSTIEPIDVSAINLNDQIATVKLYKRKYVDRSVSPGTYYYILVPENYKSEYNFQIKPGINYTKPIEVEGKRSAGAIHEPGIFDNSTALYSIDIVIKKLFYKNKYDEALRQFIEISKKPSDSYERAKANYFIGRTYFELKQYNKALKYFLRKDVRKSFPDEAEFWKNYCLRKKR